MCKTGGPRCSAHIASDIIKERQNIENAVERARVAELQQQLGFEPAGKDLSDAQDEIEARTRKLRDLENAYDETPQGMRDAMDGFPDGAMFQGGEVNRRTGAYVSQVARGKAVRDGQNIRSANWEVSETHKGNDVRFCGGYTSPLGDSVTVTSPTGESVKMWKNGALAVETPSGIFNVPYSLSRDTSESGKLTTTLTIDESGIGDADRWHVMSSLQSLGYKTGLFKGVESLRHDEYEMRTQSQPTILASNSERVAEYEDGSREIRRSLAFSLRGEKSAKGGHLKPQATEAMSQMAERTMSRAEQLPQSCASVGTDNRGERFLAFRPSRDSSVLMDKRSVSYSTGRGERYCFFYDKQAVLKWNGTNWETHPFSVSYQPDGYMRARFLDESDANLKNTLSLTGLFQ